MGRKASEAKPPAGAEKFERCVLCGCLTTFKARQPVTLRTDYIEGAGQLCSDCAKLIYGKKNNGR